MTDEQISFAHGLMEILIGFLDAGQHELAQNDFRPCLGCITRATIAESPGSISGLTA
jgi:hypothetical protein